MDRMISGRVWLACVSLFFPLHVCLAFVSVKVTPTVDVIIGETAWLPCTFSTTGNMTVVQWFIESAGTRKRVAFRSSKDDGLDKDTPLTDRVTMETDMTLVISPVKVMDERSFFCQVDGGPVGTAEAETKLKVFYAPEKPVVSENKQVIPVSPENPTAHQVGKCTSSNGHPEPRIIWFKDSKPLPEVADPKDKLYMVPGVVKESSGLFTVTSTLYIRPNKMDAKSVFHCTVEYRMPNEEIKKENSEPFNLTLLYPAENVFFKLLNTSPIKEGDEVRMKCETDGNPQPQFEFSKDTNFVTQTSETGLLILRNVTRSDSGTYSCEAMDFDSLSADLTKNLAINVHHLDPVSVVPASPLMISKGDPIELQCKTRSSDEYTLSWMKDGKQLSQKGVLALQSANLDNAGEYVCIASVPSVPGLQKQANITVIISGQPEIDEPMTGKVARQGDKVTLRCSAQGYPAPQFTWKPSGKESLEINGNKFTSTVILEATAAVLKDGVICEANNEHGADSKKFTVEIQSDNTIDSNGGARGSPVFATADTQQGGSKGVVVAVLVCVLLLLLLVAVLYFFGKRGRMACRKKEKKDVASGEVNSDIVVEMKSGEKPNEESGLLNKPHVEQ
ncbi:basal cell adhesion molecule isoform X1 [Pangasianodon hypophthalmus]|uniref:basal cell adhesion molecule isoform X1 n=1 Tax=Pangasianodon hypophthalmus TaxID=310915 RepID=UPI000EFFDBDC|nr:basal cell adhesion molecule isoform X1 [Pangasianodon hypophthalmus]